MAEDWRIVESRDQALLYVVLRAVRELVPGIGLPVIPEPLYCNGRPLLEEKFGHIKKQPRRQSLQRLVDDLSRNYSADGLVAAAIAKEKPWKTKAVVRQWVELGSLIAAWKRALDAHQEELQRRASAAQTEQLSQTSFRKITRCVWRGLAGSTSFFPSRNPTHTGQSVAATPDVAVTSELMEGLRGELSQSPAWWCAMNAADLDISPKSFDRHADLLLEEATEKAAALRSLVDWCCEVYLRQPKPLAQYREALTAKTATAGDYARQSNQFIEKVASSVFDLLGDKPTVSPVDLTNIHHWRQPFTEHTSGLALEPLAQPLFVNNQIYARGSLFSPSVERLANLIASKADNHSLATASRKARKSFEKNKKSVAETFAASQRPCSAEEFETLYKNGLPLIRLLTLFAAKAVPESDVDNAKVILKHDGGIDIILAQPLQDAAEPLRRHIPYTAKHASEAPQRAKEYTITKNPSFKMAVGIIGQPYLGGADKVGDCVEDLDWRLWLIRDVMRQSLVDSRTKKMLQPAIDCVDYQTWEQVKREWIADPSSPSTLITLHNHVHRVRMKLHVVDKAILTILEPLLFEVGQCAKSILAQLEAAHPEAFNSLYPPRRNDGRCNLDRWISPDICGDPRGQDFRLSWEPSDKPFGTHIRERFAEDGDGREQIKLWVSAGKDCSKRDLQILNAPFFVICPTHPSQQYFAPLHTLAQEVWRASNGKPQAIVAEALNSLRTYYQTVDGRPAFDALMQAALRGEPYAVEWVQILQQDDRFQLQCHPPIECDGKKVTIRPAATAEALAWQDHNSVPQGKDAFVFFSLAKEHARRVISRGRPSADSPERLALLLEESLRDAPENFRTAGPQLCEATDRWRTFPANAAHPLATESIKIFLETLPRTVWEGQFDVQEEVVNALAQWTASLGHRLVPTTWHPLNGTVATDSPACDTVRFHPTVPQGHFVVERFGLDGQHASAWAGHHSAGPAPAGYSTLIAAAQDLSDDLLLSQEVKKCLAELPRHYLAGKAPLAGPALFNAVWGLVLGAPEAVQGSGAAWTNAVAELLKSSCGMALFEPVGLGEYPSSWLQAPDGKSPRGDWIVKVVRPGVRTVKNTLVWPAVVETE